VPFIYILIKDNIMAWKVKEQYKDFVDPSMSLACGKLRPHQIKNLREDLREKYFTNDTPKKATKKKAVNINEVKIEAESYNDYTD
jgi:hypothetical protein